MRKKAFELIQSYLLNSSGLTIRQLSLLLCQDLDIAYRSARENYVLPLVAHKVLIPVTELSIYYFLNPEWHISKSGKIVFVKYCASSDKISRGKRNVGKETKNLNSN
jgi:hypothetical protein